MPLYGGCKLGKPEYPYLSYGSSSKRVRPSEASTCKREKLAPPHRQDSVAGELNWVFQDVHQGGAAHAAGLRPGDILVAVDDKRLVPPTVPVFRMGGNSTATVQGPSVVANRMRIDVPKPKSSRHPINVPRAVAHLSLPSQVGYLKINMFPGVIGN